MHMFDEEEKETSPDPARDYQMSAGSSRRYITPEQRPNRDFVSTSQTILTDKPLFELSSREKSKEVDGRQRVDQSPGFGMEQPSMTLFNMRANQPLAEQTMVKYASLPIQGLTVQQALQRYQSVLTNFEHHEVANFKGKIYTIGNQRITGYFDF